LAEKTRSDKQDRRNRVWSSNSNFFHKATCPAVDRIAKENRRSGTAPTNKVAHSCIEGTSGKAVKPDDVITRPTSSVNSNSPRVPHRRGPHQRVPHQRVPHQRVPHQTGITPANATRAQSLSPKSMETKKMAGLSHHAHITSAHKSEKHLHVNPYCQCSPCECASPCTCGLRKRETTTHLAWDADNHTLTHTETNVYRPIQRNDAPSAASTAQQAEVVAQRPAPPADTRVATADDALHQLKSKTTKHQHFLDKYALADEFSHHHHADAVSVRTMNHKGYAIEIQTQYAISIDGEPLDVHIQVSPDGKVHCHSIPNYESGSTVDLIRAIVDTFRDDFPPKS